MEYKCYNNNNVLNELMKVKWFALYVTIKLDIESNYKQNKTIIVNQVKVLFFVVSIKVGK